MEIKKPTKQEQLEMIRKQLPSEIDKVASRINKLSGEVSHIAKELETSPESFYGRIRAKGEKR